MDAINKKQRTLAIWQFALIYGCSMIIPFAAAAFFFSTPTDALEQENEKLRIALSEQVKLNVRLEKMVKQLALLEENDKAYLNATTDLDRGNVKRSIDESENMIRSAVYDLKRDTASFKVDSAKIFSKNILLLVDASLTYRNTIAYLREALQKNGVNTQAVDKLNADLSAKDDKIHMLELLLAQAAAAKPAPSSGGGGGARPRNEDRAADCALYVSRLKNAEDEIARLRAVNSGNNAGSNTNTGSASESSVREKTTSEFIDMLIQRGDDSKKPPCARKPMYELAIETLNKSSKAEARNKIEDLNKKIRKISD
ncbi:hypothetical protein QNI16_36950 [Cytophagaceae bacterium YF14B1]|uniref:Uncharacterized protein n=1 Tax=Xanthocytophaga flava TaxID=3048013 RepID=A0AAE3QZS2_9BACT|nr:hypothetical protein [Xanthocytophaga flavus]MDJ1486130.1 hypothetical protein [Xanthocytophaga flavus]